MANRKELLGQRFGSLTVLAPAKSTRDGMYWLCRCDCGNEIITRSVRLLGGRTKTCGCKIGLPHWQRKPEEWLAAIPAYRSWANMMQRCYNPKATKYAYWGGRGVKVCERWHEFDNFYKDMGDRPVGMSIDRIDNNGDYEPGNCRWATPKEQRANTRPHRKHKPHVFTKPRKDKGVPRGPYKGGPLSRYLKNQIAHQRASKGRGEAS